MTEVINKNGIPFDIDAIATDLNNKMDRDGLNSLASVCVESYVNGTSWYRVYSDGWCEQGGQALQSSGSERGSVTVTLLKPFKDINYTINGTYDSSTATNTTGYYSYVANRTTTGFDISTYSGRASYWRACGYIN